MSNQEEPEANPQKVSPQQPPKFSIEPFDPEIHDRDGFTCGVSQVDNFFKKTANKLIKAGNSAVYVMASQAGDVAGFYAMNTHAIHFENLPPDINEPPPITAQFRLSTFQ